SDKLDIWVYRWENSWVRLGTNPVNAVSGQSVFEFAIEVDSSNRPVLAFRESDGTRDKLFVSRWDGMSWNALGPALNPSANQSVAGGPSLVLDDSDRPIVEFTESDGVRQNIYTYRLDGTTSSSWNSVVGALNPVNGNTVLYPP